MTTYACAVEKKASMRQWKRRWLVADSNLQLVVLYENEDLAAQREQLDIAFMTVSWEDLPVPGEFSVMLATPKETIMVRTNTWDERAELVSSILRCGGSTEQCPPRVWDSISVKDGVLEKKGQKRRNWQLRWFLLTKSSLAYYDSKPAMGTSLGKPKGNVDFSGGLSVAILEDADTEYYKFVLNPGQRALTCRHVSPTVRQEWVDALVSLGAVFIQDPAMSPIAPGGNIVYSGFVESQKKGRWVPRSLVLYADHHLSYYDSAVKKKATMGAKTGEMDVPVGFRVVPIGKVCMSVEGSSVLELRFPSEEERAVWLGHFVDAGADVEYILKEGWLEKKGSNRRNWKKRWFVLTATYLLYCDSPPSCLKDLETSKGKISLPEGGLFSIAVGVEDLRFSLTVDGRTLHMRGSSVEEREEWVEVLTGLGEAARRSLLEAATLPKEDGTDETDCSDVVLERPVEAQQRRNTRMIRVSKMRGRDWMEADTTTNEDDEEESDDADVPQGEGEGGDEEKEGEEEQGQAGGQGGEHQEGDTPVVEDLHGSTDSEKSPVPTEAEEACEEESVSMEKQLCEDCESGEEATATLRCIDCDLLFCAPCSASFHTRKRKNHEVVSLAPPSPSPESSQDAQKHGDDERSSSRVGRRRTLPVPKENGPPPLPPKSRHTRGGSVGRPSDPASSPPPVPPKKPSGNSTEQPPATPPPRPPTAKRPTVSLSEILQNCDE